jgi:hypothetical protein
VVDFLLRWATRGKAAAALVLLMGGSLVWNLRDYPISWYRAKYYPAAAVAPDSRGASILAEKERRESDAVSKRYVALMMKLEEARRQGFQVAPLEEAARAVLALNRPGSREAARRKLNEIELAVPRKKSQYIPMAAANPEDLDPGDVPQNVAPAPSPKKKRRKAARR